MLAGDLGSLNCGLKIRKKNLTPDQSELAAFLQEAFKEERSPPCLEDSTVPRYLSFQKRKATKKNESNTTKSKITSLLPSLQKFKPNQRVLENSSRNFKSMATKPSTSHSKPLTETVMGNKWQGVYNR